VVCRAPVSCGFRGEHQGGRRQRCRLTDASACHERLLYAHVSLLATFLAGQRSRRQFNGICSFGKPVRGAILSSGIVGIQPQLHLGGRAARQLDYARPSTHAAIVPVGQTTEAASDIHGTSLDGTARPLLSKGDETVGGRVFRLNLNTRHTHMPVMSQSKLACRDSVLRPWLSSLSNRMTIQTRQKLRQTGRKVTKKYVNSKGEQRCCGGFAAICSELRSHHVRV